MSNKKGMHQAVTVETAREETLKIQAGLIDGNLKHLVNRVAAFKEEKKAREAKKKSKVVTPETLRQEEEALEFEKFMDFSNLFGNYHPFWSKCVGEPVILGRITPFRNDITFLPDGTQEIRYRNFQLLWPLRIIQSMYASCQRKEIIRVGYY